MSCHVTCKYSCIVYLLLSCAWWPLNKYCTSLFFKVSMQVTVGHSMPAQDTSDFTSFLSYWSDLVLSFSETRPVHIISATTQLTKNSKISSQWGITTQEVSYMIDHDFWVVIISIYTKKVIIVRRFSWVPPCHKKRKSKIGTQVANITKYGSKVKM